MWSVNQDPWTITATVERENVVLKRPPPPDIRDM